MGTNSVQVVFFPTYVTLGKKATDTFLLNFHLTLNLAASHKYLN